MDVGCCWPWLCFHLHGVAGEATEPDLLAAGTTFFSGLNHQTLTTSASYQLCILRPRYSFYIFNEVCCFAAGCYLRRYVRSSQIVVSGASLPVSLIVTTVCGLSLKYF